MSRVLPGKLLETERNFVLLEAAHRLMGTSWSLFTLSIVNSILDDHFQYRYGVSGTRIKGKMKEMGRKKLSHQRAPIDRSWLFKCTWELFKLWSDARGCPPPARALQYQHSLLGCSGCNTSAEKFFNCCHYFIARNIQPANRPLGEYAPCCNFPKATRL